MIEKIKRFHQKLKVFIVDVLFKKYLVPMALISTYFFVLGPTSIFARIFFRRSLTQDEGNAESSWQTARDYHPSLEDSLKQS